MFKKLFLFFISIMLLALSSCNSFKNESILNTENVVYLTLWHYYNGTHLAAFENMVKDFNQTYGKEYGIFVEAISQSDVNSLADKVLDAANGVVGVPSLPDIFAAYPDTAFAVKQLGLTANIADYLSEEELNEYVESFWDEGRFFPDYAYTIFPIAKSTEVLYVERFAWEEFVNAISKDNDYPDVSLENLATWEGILDTAELYFNYTDSLTPDIYGDGKSFFGLDSAANFILISLCQNGLELEVYDNTVINFNLDKEALRKIWNMYYSSVVRGYFSAFGRYRSDDAKTGRLISYVGSSSGSKYFPNEITYDDGTHSEADMIVLPMPVFANGKKIAIQQGAGMVITKSDEKKELASALFLKWFTESKRNVSFALESSYLPVKNESISGLEMSNALAAYENSEDYSMRYTSDMIKLCVQQLETHESHFTPPFKNSLSIRRHLESMLTISNESRRIVEGKIKEGISYAKAISEVDNDEEFESWYLTLKEICEKVSRQSPHA